MITKFKIFETVDEIETEEGKAVGLAYEDIYPFIIKLMQYEIYVGDEGSVHSDLYFLKKIEEKEDDIQGRIWLQHKIIAIWHLNKLVENKYYRSRIKEIFDLIADKFEIDIYSDWKLDVVINENDIEKLENNGYYIYFGYDGKYYALIPVNDFIIGNYNIEDDSDTHILHLMKYDKKRKELFKRGYEPKIKRWKDWQKPFESLNYQELYNKYNNYEKYDVLKI